MGNNKRKKAAAQPPQSEETATQDSRGASNHQGGDGSLSSPTRQGHAQGGENVSTGLDCGDDMDRRMMRVEEVVHQLAMAVGNVTDSINKMRVSRQTGRSRKRQRSPTRRGDDSWSRSRSRSTSGSSDGHHKGRDKAPFNQSNFIHKSEKVDCFEALVLVNIRTIKQMLEQEEEVDGIIDHIELLCEKALTRVYRPLALCSYDRTVRDRANIKGISAFKVVENSDVLRHFAYDSTIIAEKGKSKPKTSTDRVSGERKNCFNFNKNEGGCKIANCKYAHKCMYCLNQSHGASTCPSTGKPGK